MKFKLRLTNRDTIARDPETGITWEGDKIVESEITPFVANKIGAKALEIVEEENGKQDTDQ